MQIPCHKSDQGLNGMYDNKLPCLCKWNLFNRQMVSYVTLLTFAATAQIFANSKNQGSKPQNILLLEISFHVESLLLRLLNIIV